MRVNWWKIAQLGLKLAPFEMVLRINSCPEQENFKKNANAKWLEMKKIPLFDCFQFIVSDLDGLICFQYL